MPQTRNIQDCYGLIEAESDRTYLWPVRPQKNLRAPSGRDCYNTFCEKKFATGKIYNATLQFFKNLQRAAAVFQKSIMHRCGLVR